MHRKLPDGDILIHAGDFTRCGHLVINTIMGSNCGIVGNAMEPFNRRRWRFVLAKAESCCVYDRPQNKSSICMAIFRTCLTFVPIQLSISFYLRIFTTRDQVVGNFYWLSSLLKWLYQKEVHLDGSLLASSQTFGLLECFKKQINQTIFTLWYFYVIN